MQDKILQRIAQADAQHPFREDELQRGLGVGARTMTQALNALYATRQINRASITRQGATFGVVWPTGMKPVPVAAFNRTVINPNKRPTPPRKPAAPARNEETTMGAQQITNQDVLNVIQQAGKEGIPRAHVLREFSICSESAVDMHLAKLAKNGQITRPSRGLIVATSFVDDKTPTPADPREKGRREKAHQEAGEAVGALVAHAENLVSDVREKAPRRLAPDAAPMSFSVTSEGSLTIFDGDKLLELPPTEAQRLARFVVATLPALHGGAALSAN